MGRSYLFIFFVALFGLFGLLSGSRAGDADPVYQACVKQCKKTGCVGNKCSQNCNFSSSIDGPWYPQEPLYVKWKQWVCQSDCRYHCMLSREEERQKLGYLPHKYHRKWPYKSFHGIQEPVTVALSALNLAIHFHGWISFFILVNYKLPFRPNKKTYYEYTGLLHVYALFAMNAWFWRVAFHIRDVELTSKLDYLSAAAVVGYSFFLSIVRCFSVRTEAARVMVAAPIVGFMITHALYMSFYERNHVFNAAVCMLMVLAEIILWAVWAGVSRHPARWKLWVVLLGACLAMLLQVCDFAPYWGFVDAHAVWHAIMIPMNCLWWSFVQNDSEFRTVILVKIIIIF